MDKHLSPQQNSQAMRGVAASKKESVDDAYAAWKQGETEKEGKWDEDRGRALGCRNHALLDAWARVGRVRDPALVRIRMVWLSAIDRCAAVADQSPGQYPSSDGGTSLGQR